MITIVPFMVSVVIGSGKQVMSDLRRLIVVEVLIMGKRLREIENVNHSSHVCVNQADDLEVADDRESYGKGLPVYQRTRGHAC
jgi:hypothetical protein